MKKVDFIRLIGGNSANAEYLPVACLLANGYGCAGYFVPSINEEFTDTCVLVNARLIDLKGAGSHPRRSIEDFNEFLEEIVRKTYQKKEGFADNVDDDVDGYGRTIPLMAVGYEEITLLYPVTHISTLMRRAAEEKPPAANSLPTFLDFDNRSIVLKLLRTKLW
jgi:hypothetical protein